MNTKSLAKMKPFSFFGTFTERFFPSSLVGQVLIWTLCPLALLLSSTAIAYFHSSPLAFYLPLISIAGIFACARWRTLGIGFVFLGLVMLFMFSYQDIPNELRTWNMGIILSLGINTFIFLLCLEEIEMSINVLVKEVRLNKTEAKEKASALELSEKDWFYEKEKFEKEIEQLKEVAEQRRIEKSQLDQKFNLLDSEIQMLTEQKTELISDAFNARRLASERLGRLEEQTEEVNHLIELLQKSEQDKKLLESRFLENQNQNAELDPEQSETLYRRISELENRLLQAREELTSIQERTSTEKESLQEQISFLKEQLETKAPESNKTESQEDLELKRVYAQAEGLYKQLRVQFDEKSKILSQTRKELFQTQGKLLSLENESKLQELDFDPTEFHEYIHLLRELEKRCEALEEEIVNLEELVSSTID